jgi:transposase-like protein
MISNDTRRHMVELIASGELSNYQIAARLHITPSTVRKATRQLKQQQAGTYKPRGRSFYAVPLIDLVPKTTKLDDAKSATVKANRLELIKAAMQKRNAPPPALADIPIVEASGIMCGDEGATAEFGRGRVMMTVAHDKALRCRALRLTSLAVPHLHSSEVTHPPIDLIFHNRASVQSLIDHLQTLMKGFAP